MSLTVSFKNNQLSLTRNGTGAAVAVTPEQQTAWTQKLNALAAQQGMKDANELLSKDTIVVPEEGDSQWKIGEDLGVTPKDIAEAVVPTNVQFTNPDLIQAYHDGDTNPDFVLIPAQPAPDTRDAPPAPAKADTSSPQAFGASLAKAPDDATRNKWITDYVNGSSAKPMDLAKDLLKLDYGKDNQVDRRQILRATVDKIAGKDHDKQKQALKDLAEIDWKNGKNESIDVQIDTDVYAVAKDLGFKRDDIPSINKDVKEG